ncbi:MAG: hypothetical protein IM561_09050 [Microcystis sp. M60BS1]|uniref:MazG nucleotide pyrophosphohydrolase domain-containing protein n=1 Tax=unclassified Microcystis TaxID=2643300 RepID=UPI00257AB0A5|nr:MULTISPECIES: MazG nucleotide pyrophosphohydrolase domain-containing protein [unclassified Microcystis]MCA2594361.1 hypothetical protein [Microcystis sp. M38BS1]MCA6581462.1 hypothetical protein [Pseudanabaena sp. M34BS1SP1A06MG]MCA2510516.1 hypothetical protein [Microcystis sp. M60BS1]MCA2555750.1 hypothetical protein [Microcystis sp. M43BS1]MCA2603421.1 hypothetical protein [Microcystis sp. M26BS1]
MLTVDQMFEEQHESYSAFVSRLTPTEYMVPNEKISLDLFHAAMGISTEAGEILDLFKKKFAYGRDIDVVNLVEELGDLLWYIQLAINALNVGQGTAVYSIPSLISVNKNKLNTRFKNTFTSEEALNRDLEQERIVLESSTNDGQTD